MSDIHTCSYYCDRPACIKAQRDELRDRFQVMQAALQSGEPIAAVKGWFHGECIIQALDPAAVLPAGMALYAAPQPVVDEVTTTPPCDCIENVNGRWVQSCQCRNAGDLLSAQDWCTYNNLLSAGKETV